MLSKSVVRDGWRSSCLVSLAVLVVMLSATAPSAKAQFSSGSDGTDGALDLTGQTGVVNFNPASFSGDQDALGIYNFTYITIPAGVTLVIKAAENAGGSNPPILVNGPIYFLASGNVDIEGTIDMSGAPGYTGTSVGNRFPSIPGAGGYPGAPGPNQAGNCNVGGGGPGGTSTGGGGGALSGTNLYLRPLVGGSGGGACYYYGNNGGGAGGGAIMIASSGTLTLNGLLNVSGGAGGGGQNTGGGGGAALLIANTVQGSGSVNRSAVNGGGPGLARIEAYTNTFSGTVDYADTTPLDLDLPGSTNGPPPPPSIMVTSVNGTTVNANPFSFPNLNLNTGQSVFIVITAHNIPVGTQPAFYFFGQPNDTAITAPGLEGSFATSTTGVNVVVPAGASFGYVRAKWTQ